MSLRIHLSTLGCRVNQSETEDMARQLAAAGHVLVRDPARADLLLVNTCAVTSEAERKSRHRLRALGRANPSAHIVAVGCAATLDPQGLAGLPGVLQVLPNAAKERIADVAAVVPCSPAGPTCAGDEKRATPRTRALVKVQDGCDQRCTYCIVPRLRGPARSRPVEEVLLQVSQRVAAGCREIVLTGVNLSAYGRDLGLEQGLTRLVEAILAQTALPRLRLSSVEPWGLDDDFFALWADRRLCRQLHLPLQAGCDETLRRMGRRTTTAEYARLVQAARAAAPDLALTTDLLVGFPGEDEPAFAESAAFVERMGFARLHVFPFSPRPGTPAARMAGQVSPAVRWERARRMQALGARLAEQFGERFVGQEMNVLWERVRADGLWVGLTDNYLRVVACSPTTLHNRITATRLIATRKEILIGEVQE